MDFFVDGDIGFPEVLAALAVADDDVFDGQVLQHIGGHLACESALLLEVDVFRAHGDAQVLKGLGSGGDVAGGNADQGLAPLGAGHDLADVLGKLFGLGSGHVHFPVSGNDSLAVSAVHNVQNSFIFMFSGWRAEGPEKAKQQSTII